MADAADIVSEEMINHEAVMASRIAQSGIHEEGTPECIDCGDEIPLARREAAPFAKRCIECKGIEERFSRRYR